MNDEIEYFYCKLNEDINIMKKLVGEGLERTSIFGSLLRKELNQATDIDIVFFIKSMNFTEVKRKLVSAKNLLHFGIDEKHIAMSYMGNSPISTKSKTYDIVLLDADHPSHEFMEKSENDLLDVAA